MFQLTGTETELLMHCVSSYLTHCSTDVNSCQLYADGKGRGKGSVDLCIAPIHETYLSRLMYSRHRQGISQFYLHTLRFIRKRNEPYLPACAIPAVAGPHLPTPEGWKAE